jgi:hypothetical protein
MRRSYISFEILTKCLVTWSKFFSPLLNLKTSSLLSSLYLIIIYSYVNREYEEMLAGLGYSENALQAEVTKHFADWFYATVRISLSFVMHM